jgi:hypothetical protein
MKSDPGFSPCTNINSKWIKDFNVRPQTLKLVQERIEKTQEHLDKGNNVLNRIQAAQQLKERFDKWDYLRFKTSTFFYVETVIRLKRQYTEWEKIFASYTSDKGLITRIYREYKKIKLSKNQSLNENRYK